GRPVRIGPVGKARTRVRIDVQMLDLPARVLVLLRQEAQGFTVGLLTEKAARAAGPGKKCQDQQPEYGPPLSLRKHSLLPAQSEQSPYPLSAARFANLMLRSFLMIPVFPNRYKRPNFHLAQVCPPKLDCAGLHWVALGCALGVGFCAQSIFR